MKRRTESIYLPLGEGYIDKLDRIKKIRGLKSRSDLIEYAIDCLDGETSVDVIEAKTLKEIEVKEREIIDLKKTLTQVYQEKEQAKLRLEVEEKRIRKSYHEAIILLKEKMSTEEKIDFVKKFAIGRNIPYQPLIDYITKGKLPQSL